MTKRKIAVVLTNLGGPDSLDAVQPFLQNLFSDPAIIRLPALLRLPLAKLIAKKRAPIAREIYQNMGGASPILPNTQAQAQALEMALADLGEVKCFIAMRYWHPFASEVAEQIKAFAPEQIIEVPLYPQFSTSTTDSSHKDLQKALGKAYPVISTCCYFTDSGFIKAQAEKIRPYLQQAQQSGHPVRLLLSAHGLPEKIIRAGDPYQFQCEQTAKAIIAELGYEGDWLNSYQSRVGPLKWIGPSTEDEVERAGHDKVALIVVPIAFVSEHSETLVELDIEYAELAHEKGVPYYGRVPTVGDHPAFIAGLAQMVRQLADGAQGKRLCPQQFGSCACRGFDN